MTPATGILAAAMGVQERPEDLAIPHCVIGAIAVARWGEPRYTQGVDLTVLCPFGLEKARVSALLSIFKARVPEAEEFALRSRVVLLQSDDGTPIDISLGALPFEERCIGRSSRFDCSPDCRILTCSAEDLVVMKGFAGRERDIGDLETIFRRQRDRLDWQLIEAELKPLLEVKQDASAWDRLVALRDSCLPGKP